MRCVANAASLCLVLLFLLAPLASLAQSGSGPDVITLPAHGTVTNLKPRALYRPDPEGTLTPQHLLSSDEGFQPYDPAWEADAPPLWVKLKLKKPVNYNGDYVLLIKRRFFERLMVYAPTAGGGYRLISSGANDYQPTKMFGHWYVYTFTPSTGKETELLVHVKVVQHSLNVFSPEIQDSLAYQSHRSESLWAFGLYFGAMLALIFYNFILYLNLRTPGHRLYVSAMICVILLMALNAGLLQEYLPLFVQERWPMPLLTMHCLVAAASARFFQVFVNSKAYIPRGHKVVTALVGLNLLLAALTLVWPIAYSTQLGLVIQPVGTLSLLALMILSVLAGIRGSTSGYVFFAAWVAFSVGGILWSLLSFDVIARVPAAEYSLYIGSVLEAMILALGLSYRVGQLRTQRNVAMREQQKAARLANIDPLTGAYNRRFVENYLDGLLISEDKRAFQGSLIMLDLDNFKPINDQYGHPTGDAVLQEVVHRCEESLRSEDVLARLGGDEFAIVLPDQSGEDARAVAERIRQRIAAESITVGMQPIPISISVGGVTDFQPGATAYSAFKHADLALYEAKRAGRNKVVLVAGGQEPAPERIAKPV